MNNRIERLRKALFAQTPKVCSERCKIFTDSMKKNWAQPIAIKRANAFYDVLSNITLWVKPDELIVGSQAQWPKGAPIYPEYSYKWIIEELDGKPFRFEDRPGDRFEIDPKEEKVIRECCEYWEDKNLLGYLRAALPEKTNQAWDSGIIDETWVVAAGLGNQMPDFGEITSKGLCDIITRAKAELASVDTKEPGGVKKKFFLEGVIRSNEAVLVYANRMADVCKKEADKCEDETRKKELLEMEKINRRVPCKPAESFHEAVQSVYTVLMAMHLETNGHANSLGRFDQYLYPYYKKDIEEGNITREKALEIVECFIIKCNELNKMRAWGDAEFFLGYHMAINLAVGGQNQKGEDSVNDVSHIVIEACADVRLMTPSVSVKVADTTPDKFMRKALDACVVHQGGMPAFYNDNAFMRTLRNMGVAEEDLCNWAPDGCIEASIPGKWDFAAKGPWLNVEKVLEVTLNNGVDPKTGISFKPTTQRIENCESIDEVFEEYKQMLIYFMDMQVELEHTSDYVHCIYDINPFRASLIDDCIKRGLDLVEGGSIYSADGGPTCGSISAGDAIADLNYIVFEKKIISIEQLLHALSTNFEDETTNPSGSDIRSILVNKAPKFGNDDDKADDWIVRIEDFIGSRYRNVYHSSKYGKGPKPCCYSYSQSPVSANIGFGRCIGATPDGRKSGDAVNNGISPNNGAERNGATAACNSVGKLPSIWFQKGAIFNMRLSKDTISSDNKRDNVVDMIKVLFDKYAQQIQFNIVDNITLKDAMVHPENYEDLMVRVSGYSALFNSLSEACQMDIIRRNELDV